MKVTNNQLISHNLSLLLNFKNEMRVNLMGEAVTACQLLKVTAIFVMAELQELPQQYCLRKQEPAKLVIFTGAH